jgi:hypothetical protein
VVRFSRPKGAHLWRNLTNGKDAKEKCNKRNIRPDIFEISFRSVALMQRFDEQADQLDSRSDSP